MGYRSEVRSVIYGTEEIIDAFVAKDKLLGEKSLFFNIFKDEVQIYQHLRDAVKIIELHCVDVKWYDELDPDVKAWEQLMSEVEQLDADLMEADDNTTPTRKFIHAEFARIGDELDDNEHKYYGQDCWWLLNINREIVVDIN